MSLSNFVPMAMGACGAGGLRAELQALPRDIPPWCKWQWHGVCACAPARLHKGLCHLCSKRTIMSCLKTVRSVLDTMHSAQGRTTLQPGQRWKKRQGSIQQRGDPGARGEAPRRTHSVSARRLQREVVLKLTPRLAA